MRRKGALRVQAVNLRSRRLPTPRYCPKRRIPKMAGNTTRLLTNGSTTKTLPQPKDGSIRGAFGIGSITKASWPSALRNGAGGRYLLNAGDDASIPYGAMRLGWAACDDGWRFFNASGPMERCWLLDGSNWYWLDPETGVMATGVTQCGLSSYCFGASGAMASAGLMTAAPGIMPILLASFRVDGCINGARGIGSTPRRKLWRRAW